MLCNSASDTISTVSYILEYAASSSVLFVKGHYFNPFPDVSTFRGKRSMLFENIVTICTLMFHNYERKSEVNGREIGVRHSVFLLNNLIAILAPYPKIIYLGM